ncbi:MULTISPECIES: DUF6484 domain-containing protein [unclassified Mesorhizobium]|jgi:hypothetical protein|uniref:DUF6484 domain-containing protein n=1 Tax=unclassified Mesorhizobium TaxID=325217 RepID=UPI000FCCBB88|nr:MULTISPECIES: DUF6484 domain-containing protein [unclassified Mesorhizobium]RUU66211.1 hypothetical protein EOC99_07060 [Mesorhizobium sp. M7A.T.Ca.TU.009.01.1.1]RUU86124.1 hypothetical protein EOD03_08535 [Mesorhizobium sp. M7A.T.Ca.TU.009.01.1.2]RUV49956.1 hypothetical protein EOB77_17320 [Mesorhizobium sp. M7A.F.Ca.MR.228.00.0.0]RUT86275.1 hypothetical protein EOD14_14425 [Mesorhizobium sp. M7A.T.Ca.US.000.02.1.1]RUT92237.1 hypothetical protein EOD15_11395 [Mesorhizobium sp. M7A.T.Ca.US.
MTKTRKRIEGVIIGVFLGFDDEAPLVVFPGNTRETAVRARSLAEMSSDMIGSEVALLFEDGDVGRPLIVGRIVEPSRKPRAQVKRDGEQVRIVGEERIELRCGKATIIMEKDGHIIIRGTYVTSHASATNRIRGGSVNLN